MVNTVYMHRSIANKLNEMSIPTSFDKNDIMTWPTGMLSVTHSEPVEFDINGYFDPKFVLAAFYGFRRWPSNNYLKRHHMSMRRKSTYWRWGGRYL